MKRSISSFLFTALIGMVLMSAAPYVQSPDPAITFIDQNLVFPDEVMAIIENKCMGCHKPDSRNEKAREKLQWEKLAKLQTEDLISKLDAMLEVLEEGAMPPAKMLEKYPEMKLAEKETIILKQWADENIDRLIGE